MGKIPVRALYVNCQKAIDECWGYIYGTAGVKWTEAKQKTLREKYSEDDPKYGMSVKYGSQWIDHIVTDCSGLIVHIWREYGLSIPHGSSSMVSKGYIVDCGSVPHPGWAALVDPTPDTPDNNHIGIVGEDGITVYEAKGAKAGVVTSKVTDKKWTKFGRFKDVDYEGGGGGDPVQTPYYAEVVTKSGSLNVRSGPGTEYEKVGKLEKGAIVEVITHNAAWDYIRTNSLSGYVSNVYLKPIIDPAPIDPVDPVEPTKDEVTIRMPAEKWKQYVNVLNELLEYLKTNKI